MDDLNNDIDKYLKGELSSADMHRLEKRALNDPFLADALDGASQISADEFGKDIRALQQALARKTNRETKVISFWQWSYRIAAGVALVALSVYFALQVTSSSNKENIAQTDSPKESSQALTPGSSAPSSDSVKLHKKELLSENTIASKKEEPKRQQQASSDLKLDSVSEWGNPSIPPVTGEVADAEVPLELQETIAASPEKPADPRTEQHAVPVMREQEKIAMDDDVIEKKRKAEDTQNSVAQALSGRAAGVTTDRQHDKQPLKKISGYVTASEDGKGIPGVNVLIKGTNIGTVTDAEGKYEITLSGQQQPDLTFSFIGMESKEVTKVNEEELNVSLDPDVSQLSEVVVVGYGAERKSEEDENVTFEMAAPAGGRRAFKKYLEQNLQYPVQALNNQVEGKVTIQFTVEKSGALSDFKVVKSLGSGCDEEVIRLIKNGPAWSPTKKASEALSDRVKVRVRFVLPKKK
jgi:TonB family protein